MQSITPKNKIKYIFKKIYGIYSRFFGFQRWKVYAKKSSTINIILGASITDYKDWFSTDIFLLDVTKKEDFQRLFNTKKIDKILAEHVLEHLTDEQITKMLQNILIYANDNINIRIAVPDGFHKDESYINYVKPNGLGLGADDHKQLFNYQNLSKLFEENGFKANVVEYWDENHLFHQGYQNDDKGYIRRSFINDERNKDKSPNYTSLIIDFIKK